MVVIGKTCLKTFLLTRAVYWHVLAVALCWGNRKTNERPTWASTGTSEKKAKWTRLMIIDSQAVKNTCNASVKSKGFCAYKATNGIKRHLAVDTLGFPFFSHCTKANVSDDQGLIEMLSDKVRLLQS